MSTSMLCSWFVTSDRVGALAAVAFSLALVSCEPSAQVTTADSEAVDTGDAGHGADAAQTDTGMTDSGMPDAGRTDAGRTDAGETDAGETDAGETDAGETDAGRTDAGETDAVTTDNGTTDAAAPDTAAPDTAVACPPVDAPTQLIADRSFQRGFIPKHPDTGDDQSPMPTGFSSCEPIWSLAQWDSLTSLVDATRQTLPSGSVRWEDGYGRVTVGLPQSVEAELLFGVWAYEEYGGVYHVPSADRKWVHLLASQRISPPGVTREGCPPLSSLAALDFSVDARLLQDDPHYLAGHDPSRHAAHYLIYFTVQNLRPEGQGSPGYGDYLWFGLTLYDDREAVPGLSVAGDSGGTGKLIYNIGAAPFITQGLTVGGPEQRFAGDLLPHIRAALLEAWDRGYLPDSQLLSDYRIGGMNIGWEVPGLNDVELQVRGLSLTYQRRPAEPLVYSFDTDGDAEGWTALNLDDTNGGPLDGRWILNVPGSDPMLVSPDLELEAATHSTLRILVANNGNPPDSSVLQVFWERFGEPGFREAWSATTAISNGGGWQTLDIDLSADPEWRGEISKLRIDPIRSGDGHAIGVDEIALLP